MIRSYCSLFTVSLVLLGLGGMWLALLDQQLSSGQLVAAPAPVLPPTAILKDTKTDADKKRREDCLSEHASWLQSDIVLTGVMGKDEILNLESVKMQHDVSQWLKANLHVETDLQNGEIRVTFNGGTRNEQVAIIQAFLGAYKEQYYGKNIVLKNALDKESQRRQQLLDQLSTFTNKKKIDLWTERIQKCDEYIEQLHQQLATPPRVVVTPPTKR